MPGGGNFVTLGNPARPSLAWLAPHGDDADRRVASVREIIGAANRIELAERARQSRRVEGD